MPMSSACGRTVAGLAALAAAATLPPPRASAEDQAKPYHVENGRVDQNTYNGYRRYGDACLRCHGPDGAGSSYGPDLTASLKRLSEDQFKEIVINGKQDVSSSSTLVMPAFGTTEDVVTYLDDIYAYLKARSDGAVGRGRPKRIGRED